MALNQLDGLAIGDCITVTDNLRHPDDHSFQGWVLTVLAIDSPFLVVQSRLLHQPMNFDARQWTFKKLSEDYVRAMGKIVPLVAQV